MPKVGRSALLAATMVAAPAWAQVESEPTITVSGRYVLDAIMVANDDRNRSYALHNAELVAEADLARATGISGLRAGVHLLANFGGRPNDGAGTLQGIDNIEVTDSRAKLYEAWLEKSFAGGRVSLLAGLGDLNAAFYANDAAGLLIAPAFGIGSELAATGPNGPSIFPSTALMARLNVAVGGTGYARAAVINANAGVLGDPNGVDFRFRDGVLFIAEGGTEGRGKLALGVWRYSHRQDDIRALAADGGPAQRIAQGAYLLIEHQLSGEAGKGIRLFLRTGLSEGKTTPFRGGGQMGVLIEGLIPGRPDGAFSAGLQRGTLARGYRDNLRDEGISAARHEDGIEFTYQDKLAPFLAVQPDLQYVRRVERTGDRGVWIAGLRLVLSFGDD
ncbi:carbohydrate porin [Sphingomonas sp. RS6]